MDISVYKTILGFFTDNKETLLKEFDDLLLEN